MEKMKNKSIAERCEKTSYKNFNASVYCPFQNVNDITDLGEFGRKFRLPSDNVKIGRAYIECYRGEVWASKEQLLKVKGYFEGKGIATSGGLTTCAGETGQVGFISLCYSGSEGRESLRKAVALNADFYFLNYQCKECIAQKGSRTWPRFYFPAFLRYVMLYISAISKSSSDSPAFTTIY